MYEHFNVNFNVRFDIFLEQSSCVFSWINKRRDNIKMHGKTVKKQKLCLLSSIFYGSLSKTKRPW